MCGGDTVQRNADQSLKRLPGLSVRRAHQCTLVGSAGLRKGSCSFDFLQVDFGAHTFAPAYGARQAYCSISACCKLTVLYRAHHPDHRVLYQLACTAVPSPLRQLCNQWCRDGHPGRSVQRLRRVLDRQAGSQDGNAARCVR